jgi:hypothetical protein
MKSLSLKLDDHVFEETERILADLKESRNRYINKAVDFFNKHQKRKLLFEQLRKDSLAVRDDSMKVLHEFEQLDDDATSI